MVSVAREIQGQDTPVGQDGKKIVPFNGAANGQSAPRQDGPQQHPRLRVLPIGLESLPKGRDEGKTVNWFWE